MIQPSPPDSEPPNWLVIGIVMGAGVAVAAVYYGLVWIGVILP
jgi:hypothetical protein